MSGAAGKARLDAEDGLHPSPARKSVTTIRPDPSFFDQEPDDCRVRVFPDMGMVTVEIERPHDISRSPGKGGSIITIASGAISRKQAEILIYKLKKAVNSIKETGEIKDGQGVGVRADARAAGSDASLRGNELLRQE